MDRNDRRSLPRVLIAGAGEPRLDELCRALEARRIEPVVTTGELTQALLAERPNLVLLVGDAAADDGAAGIDEVRRVAQTPVVVATDAEPLDRRLAPFALGASGVLVRREEAHEMAGELQHLLAENARRIAESHGERSETELDGLVGLGSTDLRGSPTPIEGVRVDRPARPPARPSAKASALVAEGPPAVGAALVPSLPDWDEDLVTRPQPPEDAARWRRLSAGDLTPPAQPAIDVRAGSLGAGPSEVTMDATPRDLLRAYAEPPTAPMPIPELVLARERVLAANGEPTRVQAERAKDETRAGGRPAAGVSDACASEAPPARAEASIAPAVQTGASEDAAPRLLARIRGDSSTSGSAPSPDASPEGGERISASALVALPEPPVTASIDDRARTLRASTAPRRRASVMPAIATLVVMLASVAAIAAPELLRSFDGHDGIVHGAGHARGAARAPSARPVAASGVSVPVSAPALPASRDDGVAMDDVGRAPWPATPARVEPSEPGPALGSPSEPGPALGSPSDERAALQPVHDRRARAAQLLREARALAQRGERAGARALLEQAYREAPDDPHVLIALARHHLEQRDAEQAIRWAQRASAVRRRRPDYHVVLGDAYRLAGDEARARAAFEAALAIDPDHEAARARLGP